jgi:hypothetical protein
VTDPPLEAELARAWELEVGVLADAIESIGFECTRCGACCKGYETCDGDGDRDEVDEREPHTATVFPDEVRRLIDVANRTLVDDAGHDGPEGSNDGNARMDRTDRDSRGTGDPDRSTPYDWRDVARPMPYGLTDDGEEGETGETFEWALQTTDCGDCTFYRETAGDGRGACAVHGDRPLICRTYPFSVALGGTSQPMGDPVDGEGIVRAHECEGLGRDISRDEAEELAAALRTRAIRELEEAIGVRDNYRPTGGDGVVVHDSEGQKRPDGTPFDG